MKDNPKKVIHWSLCYTKEHLILSVFTPTFKLTLGSWEHCDDSMGEVRMRLAKRDLH